MNERGHSAPDDEVSLLNVLLIIARNARLLVIGPITAGFVAFGIASLISPTFTATTRILPPQQQSTAGMLSAQLGALAGLAGAAGVNVKNPVDTYVALLRSRTVADRLIDRFDLLKIYGLSLRQDARRDLENVTKVVANKEGLIVVDVDDKDPKRAAALANAYVQELHKLTGTLAITEAQQRRVFFEKQVLQSQDNLKKAQLALGQVGAGEAVLKSAPQAMLEGIARLKAQVTAQEIRLYTMRGYLTEASPEYQLAERELASMRSQLTQAERSQPANGAAPDYLNRFREYKYQETLFELMAKQYEVARLDEAREGAAIQVVDEAVVPERKSKPKSGSIAILATLITLFVLLFVVFVRHRVQRERGGVA